MTDRAPEGRRLALFDLDFTIVPHDTMLLFCNYVLQQNRLRMLYMLFFLPAALPAAVRLISSGTIKRFFFSFLWRMPRETVEAHAEQFVRERVLPEALPDIAERIEKHRLQGDYLILNTASPHFYAHIIARELGFDACCATDLVLEPKQRLLPKIGGRNNKGAAKLDCMLEVLPAPLRSRTQQRRDFEVGREPREPAPIPNSISYSDSPADLPLLRLTETAVLVAPGEKLASLAGGRSWEILWPRLPFDGRTSKLILMIRQALGFYRPRTVS